MLRAYRTSSWKAAPLAAALFCALGCGENVCDMAADHASECQIPGLNAKENSASGMTAPERVVCQGTALCEDTCFNNATCDALSGKDASGHKAYEDCVSQCD